MAKAPTLACAFYKSSTDEEPAREWRRSLPDSICKELGSDIQKVQWRWPTSMPLVPSFGGGLYEVRTSLNGNIYRVFFCVREKTMVLLHGFTKKTQKTPASDIKLAQTRQRELETAS